MSSLQYQPKHIRRDRKKRPPILPLAAAAVVVCLALMIIPSLGQSPQESPRTAGQPSQAPGESVAPIATPTPTPTSTPTPTPTPEPTPQPFDFTQPAPAAEAVEMDYFSDALFIGDSRTDGLRLYSGIKGASFYCYKGLTIFEMETKDVIELDGGKYTVVEALERGPQYGKIYISLGINELGYYNDESFHKTFAAFLEKVRQLQPDAVIYLENLVPVNPAKCKANDQASYVNNDRVAAYNAIYPQLAQEEQVILLDVATALSDENGILPADATVDGVHFTKAWYQKWLAYLMEHTVESEVYQAGVAAAEGAEIE